VAVQPLLLNYELTTKLMRLKAEQQKVEARRKAAQVKRKRQSGWYARKVLVGGFENWGLYICQRIGQKCESPIQKCIGLSNI